MDGTAAANLGRKASALALRCLRNFSAVESEAESLLVLNLSPAGEVLSRRGMKRSGHFKPWRPGLLSSFESFDSSGRRLFSE
jgi:hypothetical protein